MRRRLLVLALLVTAALGAPGCQRQHPRPSDAFPALDEAALDRTRSPCDDFYQFACGGWVAVAPIPPDRAAWSRGQGELEGATLRQLRRILEEAAEGKADARDRFARKLGDFYAACIDVPGVEARGLAELQAEWARLDAVLDRDALVAEVARLGASRIPAPLAVGVSPGAPEPGLATLLLSAGGLSLPRDDYLSADPRAQALRVRYAAHLRTLLALAGARAGDAEADAARALRIEVQLAEAGGPPGPQGDPAALRARLDRPGLDRLAPGFPWPRLLEALGAPQARTVEVAGPALVARAAEVLQGGAVEDWRGYLRVRLALAMADAGALPAAFARERAAFLGEPPGLEPEARWKRCVRATDRALGPALAQAWLRRHGTPEARDRADVIAAELEAALDRDLGGLEWMDAATRARARDKLVRLTTAVGDPVPVPDYGALRVTRESYFRDVLAADRFAVRRALAEVGRPADRAAFRALPDSGAAYHDPLQNELVCPAGLLQPPFLNRAAPDAVNYGALGPVLGRALIHAFDEDGRRYDGEGNARDWWSPETGRRYRERAACLVRQFDGYAVAPGLAVDGARTRRENVADLAAVKLAYAAWAEARGPSVAAEQKVLGFTPEQQFFLSYAQSLCAAYRDDAARAAAASGPTAPARDRVNGPLSNLAEFSAAFTCRAGSPMVRPAGSRCEVW